jgi:hypothetical protein
VSRIGPTGIRTRINDLEDRYAIHYTIGRRAPPPQRILDKFFVGRVKVDRIALNGI